jgi:hypothetical protein
MTKPPLTPEQKEEYTRQLKAKLKTRRPRRELRMALALVIVVVTGALIWHFSRVPAESSPVLLASLDAIGSVGQPVRAQAWVKFAEGPAKVDGLSVHWQGGPAGEVPIAKTDDRGIAATLTPAVDAETIRAIQATILEPEPRLDRSRIFIYAPNSQIVIVPLAPMPAAPHVLAHDHDLDPAEIAPVAAWKSAGWRIVYAGKADDPIEYRKLREWVRSQTLHGLPDGPVVLRGVADVTAAAPLTWWSPNGPK